MDKHLSANFEILSEIKLGDIIKDAYGGVRYTLKNNNSEQIKIHPCFLKLSSLNLGEVYAYLVKPKKEDKNFDIFHKFCKELEKEIKTLIPSIKNLKPIIKDNDCTLSVGLLYKKENKEKKAIVNLFDKDNKTIAHNDQRLTDKNIIKIIYADIIVDSVYLKSDGEASLQLKVGELLIYFSEKSRRLDIKLINSLRQSEMLEEKMNNIKL
jgi:hypothetical protein